MPSNVRLIAILCATLAILAGGYWLGIESTKSQVAIAKQETESVKRKAAEKESAIAKAHLSELADLQAARYQAEMKLQDAGVKHAQAITTARTDAAALRRSLAGVRICPALPASPDQAAEPASAPVGADTAGEHGDALADDLVAYAEECEGLRQRAILSKAYAETIQ